MSTPPPNTPRIEIAEGAMSAEVVVPAGCAPPDLPSLLELIGRAGIELTEANRHLAGEAAAALAALGGGAARLTVAQGTPPQQPMPGRIAFEPGYDPKDVATALAGASATAGRPAGSVDHYTRTVFNFVQIGTHVGTVLYPADGLPGRDVLGNPVQPAPAEAQNFSFDDTLRKQDDGKLIALRPGVLEWGEAGLHITDRIVIPGSVDFSVGHVEFPGSVHVRGGVRDCFKVDARCDLVIEGLIEAASIRAGRDATLSGGMAAKEKGTLDVGRDLTARYLNNVPTTVGRDLRVDREIVNSKVSVGRGVLSPGCSIAGGSLAAACAVELNSIGSEVGVATEIRLGYIPALEAALRQAAELVEALEARRAKFLDPLEQLRAVKGRQSPSTVQRMAELEKQVEEVNSRIDPVKARMESIRGTIRAHSKVDLTVHARVYPKVLITAGNFTIDFTRELRGPVRIRLDDYFSPVLCALDGTPCGDLDAHAKVRRIDMAAGAKAAARAA